MNNKKETITINNYKGYNLGLKILLATNTRSNQIFAIVTDVNPAGYCYFENISTGDVLFSINKTEINSIDNLNYAAKFIAENRNVDIHITVIKEGVLDGTNVLKRCIGLPCSELCEIWSELDLKSKKRIEVPDICNLKNEAPVCPVKYSKSYSVDELHSQKLSLQSSEEPIIVGKQTASTALKNTYQQALPMMKHKRKSTKIVFHKNSGPITTETIPSPQPQFIKRPNTRTNNTPKQFSSLQTETSFIAPSIVRHSSTSADSSSSSLSPLPSPLQSERKASLPTEVNVYRPKPKPMPRTKHVTLTHQRSIDHRELFSLQTSIENDKEWRSANVTIQPKSTYHNDRRLRKTPDKINYKGSTSMSTMKPTNGGTDV